MAEIITSRSTTGAVQDKRGYYHGCIVTTTLSAAAVTLYDNASSASGTVVDVIPASTAAGTIHTFPSPIKLSNGLYASFAGTGAITFLTD